MYLEAGLFSKVAWLLARTGGGASHASIAVTPIGDVATSHLWYEALTNGLPSGAELEDFRGATVQAAVALYCTPGPGCAAEALETENALDAVGFWREGTNLEGLDPDGRVAFVDVEVDSAPHSLAIYKGSDGRLAVDACSASQGCTEFLSSPSATGVAPAVAVVEDFLYIFYADPSDGDVLYHVLDLSDGTWVSGGPFAVLDPQTSHPVQTDAALSALGFPEGPGIAWKEKAVGGDDGGQPAAEQAIKVASASPEGLPALGPWLIAEVPAATSDQAPSMAHVDDRVYIVYRTGPEGANIRVATLELDPANWGPTLVPDAQDHLVDGHGFEVSDVVAHSYLGRLHIMGIADGRIVYKSYCPEGSSCTYAPLGDRWTQSNEVGTEGMTVVGALSARQAAVPRQVDPSLVAEGMEVIYLRNDSSVGTLFKRSE
jgi:hypothetical protein